MNNIEKRAKEYATDLRGAYREEIFNESSYNAYINGATKQKQIDIDKACEWLNSNCRGLMSSGLRQEFRKAMER